MSKPLPNCTVGFVYNEPCPLECDFCCHTKANVGSGMLTPGNVLPMIVKYADQRTVTRFAFTGGDPFVYYTQIVEVFRRARARGVGQPFHMVTSGYWAKSDQVVDSQLSTLAGLGMDMLYVSYDLEHMKWVPPEHVYRIERACEQYGIILSVYGVFWERGIEVRSLLPGLRTTFVNQSLVAPIGRARHQKNKVVPDADEKSKYSCGKPLDYDITIYPNGDTYPCCSGGFNKEAGLLLGNSFTDDAKEIIEKCFSHFFVTIAKEIGFDKLLQAVERKGLKVPTLPKFSDVTSVCEICSAIHRNRNTMKALESVLTEMEIEYCVNRYKAISVAIA